MSVVRRSATFAQSQIFSQNIFKAGGANGMIIDIAFSDSYQLKISHNIIDHDFLLDPEKIAFIVLSNLTIIYPAQIRENYYPDHALPRPVHHHIPVFP